MKIDIQLSPSLAVSLTLAYAYIHTSSTGSISLMDICHTCSQPPLGRFSSFIFKAATVSSLYVCGVLSTMRRGPLGTIMTINNHNSGAWCFQIPNLHSSELPTTHTYTNTPFSISEFDLCSYSKLKTSVSAGVEVRWGIPGKPAWAESIPVKPGGMGWSLICSHLVNKGPDLNASSCSFRKLPQTTARSNKEKLCRTEETARNILHVNSSAHN